MSNFTADAEGGFYVEFRTNTNKCITIRTLSAGRKITKDCKVKDVLQALDDKEGGGNGYYNTTTYFFHYNGKPLREENTLRDYDMRNGGIIWVAQRHEGGSTRNMPRKLSRTAQRNAQNEPEKLNAQNEPEKENSSSNTAQPTELTVQPTYPFQAEIVPEEYDFNTAELRDANETEPFTTFTVQLPLEALVSELMAELAKKCDLRKDNMRLVYNHRAMGKYAGGQEAVTMEGADKLSKKFKRTDFIDATGQPFKTIKCMIGAKKKFRKNDLKQGKGYEVSYTEDCGVCLDNTNGAKAVMSCGCVFCPNCIASTVESVKSVWKSRTSEFKGLTCRNISQKCSSRGKKDVWIDFDVWESIAKHAVYLDGDKKGELLFEEDDFKEMQCDYTFNCMKKVEGYKLICCPTYLSGDSICNAPHLFSEARINSIPLKQKCGPCGKNFCHGCQRSWKNDAEHGKFCRTGGIPLGTGVFPRWGKKNIPWLRRCPFCRIQAGQPKHCQHITCGRWADTNNTTEGCKKQFCYICLSPWTGHDSSKCEVKYQIGWTGPRNESSS